MSKPMSGLTQIQTSTLPVPWWERYRWWLFFGCMAAINGRYVFDPPYWDMLMGMFAQAHWLAENDLNYFALLQQPAFWGGGPNIYPFCWLPSLGYAALYYVELPPWGVNAILHVLMWACGATVLATFYQLLSPVCDRWIRLFATGALMSCPMFLSHAANVNLEMPLTAVCVRALLHCQQRRFVRAIAFATLAFNLHPRGIGVLAGTCLVLLLECVFAWNARRRHSVLRGTSTRPEFPVSGVVVAACSIGLFGAYLIVQNAVVNLSEIGLQLFGGVSKLHLISVVFIPELAAFTVYMAIWLLMTGFRIFRRSLVGDRFPTDNLSISGSRNGSCLPDWTILCLCSFLTVHLVFMASATTILVRYYLIVYPVVGAALVLWLRPG